jgi:hypothetical protein
MRRGHRVHHSASTSSRRQTISWCFAAAVLLLPAYATAFTQGTLDKVLDHALAPHGYTTLYDLTLSPGREVWTLSKEDRVLFDRGRLLSTGTAWIVNSYDNSGRFLGRSVDLAQRSGLPVTNAFFLGVAPNGNLVLLCRLSDRTRRILTVTPGGKTTVSDFALPPVLPYYSFMDKTGVVHLFHMQPEGYVRSDCSADKPQLLQSERYSALFGGEGNTPRHLARTLTSGRMTLWAEGEGCVLRASVHSPADTVVLAHRIALPSLRMVATTKLCLAGDASHVFTNVPLRRMRFVPAAGGGYWLFAPVDSRRGAFAKPWEVADCVFAYRLDKTLRVVRPVSPETTGVTPLDEVPGDADLQLIVIPAPGSEHIGPTGYQREFRYQVDAIGLGSRGEVFSIHEQRSVRVDIPSCSSGEGR